MIWHIVRKELLVNLFSLRFWIGLVVIILVMGLVGYILVEEYADKQQTYLSNVEQHRQMLDQTKVYSEIEVVVDIPPSPLSVFSRGVHDAPSSITVTPYHIPSLIDEGGGSANISLSGTSNRPHNPLLRVFTSIDLCYVISIVLSLFALLLVFDSFSGEREQGTLKILLSTSTGRVHLLVGKFLGALLSLGIPLTIGFLEVMLLWNFSRHLSLDISSWIGIGFIYLFSLIFLASFLALALFVSLYAKELSSGLMYLLLGWVVVAILIPEGGEYLSEYFRPDVMRENVLREEDQARREFHKVYSSIPYQQKSDCDNCSYDELGAESLLGITEEEVYNRMEFNKISFPLKFQFAENRYHLVESYANALKSWSRIRDNFVRLSICTLYRNIVQAIAGTDIDNYERTVKNAQLYREALMVYLRPKIETPSWFTRALDYPDVQPTEQDRKYWQDIIGKQGERAVEKILSWDRVAPLDLTTMPAPQIVSSSLAERMSHMTTDALLLIGSAVLFLALSIWRVPRYPVC